MPGAFVHDSNHEQNTGEGRLSDQVATRKRGGAGLTHDRIARMPDTHVASIALELVTHVSQGLEQLVCGVDMDDVKEAIKETAVEVGQNCDVTTKTAACYPHREMIRFASVSLRKTLMLPTRQCHSMLYCPAVLEASSVNNCMSASAG